jgi:HAD superfamily hydrolase (TIGR01509 family)
VRAGGASPAPRRGAAGSLAILCRRSLAHWPDVFGFYLHRVLGALGGAAATARDALAPTLAAEIRRTIPTPRLWSNVLPGLPGALAALRAGGVRLVVVSNSDGTAEQGLAAVGLRDYVDHVVDSSRVGVEKPAPGIFLHALALADAAPERTLHVGDLYAVDVLGARGAGLPRPARPYGDWDDVDCPRAPTAAVADALLRARWSDTSVAPARRRDTTLAWLTKSTLESGPDRTKSRVTAWSSQNSSTPHGPFSRPMPLHLTPPKGMLGASAMCWFTQAVPDSSRSASASPLARSEVHTEPPSRSASGSPARRRRRGLDQGSGERGPELLLVDEANAFADAGHERRG